jgi:predicted hotdog family 3-hydroxylacyl-ACP dehydratase
MILIDRLISADGQETVCEVTISPHAPFATASGVPAFVGIEYMAQSVAAHGGYQSYQAGDPISVGLLLGTRRLDTYCQLFPVGQTLRIKVTHIWGKHELMRFSCTITDAATEQLLQQAELNVFKPSALQSYLEEARHDNTRSRHRQ